MKKQLPRLATVAVAIAAAAILAAGASASRPAHDNDPPVIPVPHGDVCYGGVTIHLVGRDAVEDFLENPRHVGATAGACSTAGAAPAAVGGPSGVYRCNVWNGLYIVQGDKVAADAAAGNRYANVILGKPYAGAPNTNPLQGSTVGHVSCESEGATLIPGVVADATGWLYDPKLTGVGYGIGSPVYRAT